MAPPARSQTARTTAASPPPAPPPPPPPPAAIFSPTSLADFVGSAGNFSIQYNLSVLGIALAFAGSHATSTAKGLAPDLPQPTWAKYSLLGMVFIGTMLGMVLLGYVGDVLGRRTGMLTSLGLVVGGALASAVLSWGSPDAAYGVIVVCRLVIFTRVLVHGCGGSGRPARHHLSRCAR